nr:hypothetical protein Iba_scaffold15400CG0040 [Ipomoea batatas]
MGARRRTGGGDWRVRGARRSELGSRRSLGDWAIADWKWIREQRRPAWLWLSETTTRLRLCNGVGNWSPKWEGGDGCSEADKRWRLATGECGVLGWRWRMAAAACGPADCADGGCGDAECGWRREIRGFRADG